MILGPEPNSKDYTRYLHINKIAKHNKKITNGILMFTGLELE